MRLMSDYNRLARSGSLLQTAHKLHTSRQYDYGRLMDVKSNNNPSEANDYGLNATHADLLSTGELITLNIKGRGLDDKVFNDQKSKYSSRDGGGSP